MRINASAHIRILASTFTLRKGDIMTDKFNAFRMAKEEANHKEESTSKVPKGIPIQQKENKVNMTISITPTNKKKLRKIANSVNMSISELIAYWTENQE